MLDETSSPAPVTANPGNDAVPAATSASAGQPPVRPRRRGRAAVREPGPPVPIPDPAPAADSVTVAAPAVAAPTHTDPPTVDTAASDTAAADEAAAETVTKPARRRRVSKAAAAAAAESESAAGPSEATPTDQTAGVIRTDAVAAGAGSTFPTAAIGIDDDADDDDADDDDELVAVSAGLAFRPPAFVAPAFVAPEPLPDSDTLPTDAATDLPAEPEQVDEAEDDEPAGTRRRRRGRRGRGRNRAEGDEPNGAGDDEGSSAISPEAGGEAAADGERNGVASASAEPAGGAGDASAEETAAGARRRRRRRRRAGGEADPEATPGAAAEAVEAGDDPDDAVRTVVHVRPARQPAKRSRDDDEVQGVKGSTRLEAKRQRRRDGRDSGRKRPSIISESEFLARREAVERVMVVREGADRTQIGALEDGVLVEHYMTKASATSYVGNVYLGRVQNVLPSMEAAFVDIGKGRNAVLYAGEVNYDASQFEGKPQRIEQALKSGDKVLVQVSKDPIGTKGSRLTSQISLPGRYVVYVPEGQRTGISRKLPDTERARLKSILKRVAPENAGLIVRTAAEGASEEELARDMARLVAQWDVIQKKAATASPPTLLHAEPDLVIRVIRDVFNEDFAKMIVQGDEEWETIDAYVDHVAPDLRERLERWTAPDDVFAAYRVDEQLAKALDRKVWLPSGGYLIFDRTEAMVVVDVNTGRYTGRGGNLEETVTRNNIEAAEELARQLRLRDLGGIIVIDFIDMVLESNRDLVLRRLMECLGRDRTKHQVAEVTSLGLVQMTRKRVGQGLQDVFAQVCPECHGRGVKTIIDPFQPAERPAAVHPLIPKPTPPMHRPEPTPPAGDDEPVGDDEPADRAELGADEGEEADTDPTLLTGAES